jgi:hypothetical protein
MAGVVAGVSTAAAGFMAGDLAAFTAAAFTGWVDSTVADSTRIDFTMAGSTTVDFTTAGSTTIDFAIAAFSSVEGSHIPIIRTMGITITANPTLLRLGIIVPIPPAITLM